MDELLSRMRRVHLTQAPQMTGQEDRPVTWTGGTFSTVISFRFSAKYTDGETGLLYYGRRYRNQLGWLSRDPMEEDGGLHLYGFCQNDGIQGVDPYGENYWLLTQLANLADRFASRGSNPPVVTVVLTMSSGVIRMTAQITNPTDAALQTAIDRVKHQTEVIQQRGVEQGLKQLAGENYDSLLNALGPGEVITAAYGDSYTTFERSLFAVSGTCKITLLALGGVQGARELGLTGQTATSPPKPSPNFQPPTNPPQLPPTDLPPGWKLFRGKPTEQYPNGYWKLTKPQPIGKPQPVDPSTMKPAQGGRPSYHVEFPPGYNGPFDN